MHRRLLGVTATTIGLPKSVIRQLDLLSEQAVQIVDIVSGGVAARSGIKAGDVLIALNDRIVTSVDDVHRILTALPGDVEIEATIVRDHSRQLVKLGWACRTDRRAS